MKNLICPVCAEGSLANKVSTENVEYRDTLLVVSGLSSSVCDACGAEVTGLEDSRANKRLIIEARKEADELLPGVAVKAQRNRYGITQREAAEIFGGGSVAFSKYESGDLAQSGPMDRLLRVAIAVPEAMEWLAGYANVNLSRKLSKPRRQSNFETVLDLTGLERSKKVFAVHTTLPETVCNNEYVTNDEKYETESINTQQLSAA